MRVVGYFFVRAVSVFLLAGALSGTGVAADDARQRIEMPPRMVEHMLANMRDHLSALQAINAALASENFGKAADVAEQQLGLSSLDDHGASHMRAFMPPQMMVIGAGMHRAASRFATITRDAELDGDLAKPLAALADVVAQCVACHSAYRLR